MNSATADIVYNSKKDFEINRLSHCMYFMLCFNSMSITCTCIINYYGKYKIIH